MTSHFRLLPRYAFCARTEGTFFLVDGFSGSFLPSVSHDVPSEMNVLKYLIDVMETALYSVIIVFSTGSSLLETIALYRLHYRSD